MSITINPSALSGTIAAPSSKSMSQRAMLAAILKEGQHNIQGVGQSNDEKELIEVIDKLGGIVNQDNDKLSILSIKNAEELSIHLGESGLSTRLLLPILSVLTDKVSLTGHGSLLKRDMSDWGKIALQLGIDAELNNNKLPILNKGNLKPATITIDGSQSSQYISGVLLAYSCVPLEEAVTVTIKQAVSTPYIDMTLDVIEAFGLNIPKQNGWSFTFNPKNILPKNIQYKIEGDWSNAAFLLVAGAILGDLNVTNIDAFTKQGDKAVLTALMDAGVSLSIEAESVSVRKSNIKAFQFDAVDCPDLFPPLVTLAAKANGTSVISGVHRLYNKESDRAKTLVETFTQLGIEINIQDDLMVIKGNPTLAWDAAKEITVANDHRIVMAATIFALSMNRPLIMKGHEAVNKSYPAFFADLKKIGSQID